MVASHVAPVHESMFAGCVVIGDLDLKRMPSRGGDDLERIKLASLRRGASEGGEEDDEGKRRPCPNSDRPHRRRSSVLTRHRRGAQAGFKSNQKSASSA
jgi:hypothetical protein